MLTVLGLDQAALALLAHARRGGRVRQHRGRPRARAREVRASCSSAWPTTWSALGFMIDMLSVQPQLAKSLFVYDADAGTLAPVMGRSAAPNPASGAAPVEPRLLEQAQMLAFSWCARTCRSKT